MTRSIRSMLAAVGAAAFLAGCATTPGSKMPKTVEERAVKRWELLIAGKADEAYLYLTSGYRQTHPKDPYITAMTHRPVKWKAIKYMDKDCSEDVCTVRLFLTYDLMMNAAVPRPVEGVSVESEKWIKTSGGWFHLPRE